jgi:hypothetical protein
MRKIKKRLSLKISLFLIAVLGLFLIFSAVGCSQKSYDDEEQDLAFKPEQDSSDTRETTSKTYDVYEQAEPETADSDSNSAEDYTVSVKERNTGEVVTFKRIEDTSRQKQQKELCDLNYPLECVDFFSRKGIQYITIKNIGYESKINQVTLRFKGKECDPVDVYIETGQIKEFECYEEAQPGTMVAGDLEVRYYQPTTKENKMKTGTLRVVME